MPARKWFRLTMATCLLTAVGCQSTAPVNWKFWRRAEHAARTDGLRDPVRTHLAYGQLQENSGNLNDARESYEIALEEDSKSVEATLGLARLEVLGGRPKDAEKRFEQALQMAPLNVHVLETTGQFYVSQGRYAEAVKLLQRGVDADPNNKRLRFRLAVAEARVGDLRAAEQNFVQAVGAAEADYNIGVILYENGNLAQAEQRLQRALIAKPGLTPAQQLIADIQTEIGAGRSISQAPLNTPLSSAVPNLGPTVPSAPLSTPIGSSAPTTNLPHTLPAAGQQAPIPVPITIPTSPIAANQNVTPSSGTLPTAPVPAPLDISRMNAAQLEQLENSMSPAEREQFRNQLRIGQLSLP